MRRGTHLGGIESDDGVAHVVDKKGFSSALGLEGEVRGVPCCLQSVGPIEARCMWDCITSHSSSVRN